MTAALTMRDLQKVSAQTLRSLPSAMPVKCGAETVALLMPIKRASPALVAEVFAQIDNAAAGRDRATKQAIAQHLGEEPQNRDPIEIRTANAPSDAATAFVPVSRRQQHRSFRRFGGAGVSRIRTHRAAPPIAIERPHPCGSHRCRQRSADRRPANAASGRSLVQPRSDHRCQSRRGQAFPGRLRSSTGSGISQRLDDRGSRSGAGLDRRCRYPEPRPRICRYRFAVMVERQSYRRGGW